MKVLVAGRQGQLSRSLVERAASRGIETVALGRPDLDLTDRNGVEAALRATAPDIVINTAAYTAVDQAETEPDLAFALNADGAGTLASASSALDKPIIHISTDYVFDGTKGLPYIETDPVAPLGVYGRSKLEGERRVAGNNPRHLILRTSWVFSPYGRNFAKTMLGLAQTRSEVSVVNDQRGRPTYALHLADALLTLAGHAAAAKDGRLWGLYHLAGQGEATWHDFAQQVFSEARRRKLAAAEVRAIATSDMPTAARRPADSRLDCRKIEDVFSVVLRDWRDGVSDCMERIAQADAGNHITAGGMR